MTDCPVGLDFIFLTRYQEGVCFYVPWKISSGIRMNGGDVISLIRRSFLQKNWKFRFISDVRFQNGFFSKMLDSKTG